MPRDSPFSNREGNVTEEKKKPPPGEYSAFKDLLDKVAKVPKAEIDEKEREYQEDRERSKRKAGG